MSVLRHACRALLIAAAVVAAAAGAAALPACAKPAPLPRIAEVPQFSLQDQNGHTLTRENLRGGVWIANFMFTSCPDVCPLLTAKMAGVRGRLVGDRKQVRYVSFSVDPEHDTPAVLKKYAIEHSADRSDWSFVTGPLDQVKRVIVSGFKELREVSPEQAGKANAILHGSHFVLIDRQLAIRGYYPSDQEGLLRLARDAAILLAEPSKARHS
jgi:protein SCO1/2